MSGVHKVSCANEVWGEGAYAPRAPNPKMILNLGQLAKTLRISALAIQLECLSPGATLGQALRKFESGIEILIILKVGALFRRLISCLSEFQSTCKPLPSRLCEDVRASVSRPKPSSVSV
jgi:hypothetical protein